MLNRPSCLSSRSGFSLVELSIVLVILGLLVGGVLGGRSLIRAAELRNITVELQQYETAVNTFRIKFNALPGDFTQATRFWGRADNGTFSGQCADPGVDVGTSPQTCNGDGNGALSDAGESVLFWEHLANAGLVTGSYTGAIASGTAMFARDTEVPSSKSGGVWIPILIGVSRPFPGYTFLLGSGQGINVVSRCGRPGPECDVYSVLTPQDAWSIDSKFDDGKPGTGVVQSGVSQSTCTVGSANLATAANATAQYNLGIDTVACVLSFPQGNRGWEDR